MLRYHSKLELVRFTLQEAVGMSRENACQLTLVAFF